MNRILSFFLLFVSSCVACGPWLPEAYVLRNDDVFYAPPEVGFSHELRHLLPESVPYAAVLTGGVEAFTDDLQEALRDAPITAAEQSAILESYNRFREVLNSANAYVDRQQQQAAMDDLKALTVPDRLPLEFQHYLKGALAYYQSDYTEAHQQWQALLELPEAQRRYRSVMAAYMLGKLCGLQDPSAWQHAPKYYVLVRELVEQGFPDPQGLAAASYGREAQYYLNQAGRVVNNYKPYIVAIDLYLKQWASGYRNAPQSLSIVAGDMWENCNDVDLAELLKVRSSRAVLTAYVLAECWGERADEFRARLCRALPNLNEMDVEEAGRFALMEYQQGNMSATRLWIDHANPKDALALWVKSKVLLRDGQIDAGRTLMLALTEELAAKDSDWRRVNTNRAWGELGLLMLQQAHFVEAADCFYKSGSWEDCAYVLERILTVDELVAWVNAQPRAGRDDDDYYSDYDVHALAARRLMREAEFDAALALFDEEPRTYASAYIAAMRMASAAESDTLQRAQSYWRAARIMRDRGLVIIGSELAPDYAWYDGHLGWSDTFEDREGNESAPGYRINRMTWDETKRGEASQVMPNKRFHYRYRATQLAELAAGLLPNNDEDAARIYCVAGEWLRVRDPEVADRLYKQLVVRCPDTELGAAAAERHWFPDVDLEAVEPFAAELSKSQSEPQSLEGIIIRVAD